MLSSDVFPPFVAKVFGGLEECPDTHRIHFQGVIQCKGQQRFSAIKKWLGKAHLEPARSAEALRKYAMKEETAVDEKRETVNKAAYIDNQAALMLLAVEKLDFGMDELQSEITKDQAYNVDKVVEIEFNILANRIVYRQPHLVGVMTKPDVYRGWKMFRGTFVKLESERRADSITARLNEVVEPNEELKDGE